MDVEYDDLEAVVALAELLHFGRAADRRHVSQPALSKRIRKLEDRIGGPLLSRRYRDIKLTEAGRLLAERGRQVLRDSEAMVTLARRAARGEAGRLRIGFGIATILGLVPDALLRFRRRHPEVQLHLRDMSTPEQIDALAAGEIDVGFVRLPIGDTHRRAAGRQATAARGRSSALASSGASGVSKALMFRPVLDERLVLAAGPRTPWNSRTGLRSVAAEPFIIISPARSACFYDHALGVCAAAGFTPRIVQEANELFTVLSLVAVGLGVSLVPRSAALMQLPGVRYRELKLPEAAWKIAVAWRRDASQDPLVRSFVEMVRGRGF
jgi:DNA-binding transcriptional LysR family regulator